MFELTETNEKQKFIIGNYFIKGIIHIIDENDFEIFEESFFYAGLEPNGHFQNQDDVGVYLQYELKELDWDIEPEIDRCYGVLYEFKCNYSTDYWGEHDMTVEPINLHFSKFDDKANEAILGCDYFQFEE
jgi:hypothetical protein